MGKQYGQLDLDERIELFRHHDAGTAPSEIARIMGRHPSTIGRELRRNSLPKAGYKPASADRMAFSRRRRSSRIERLNPLRDHVDDHLAMGWSPEQIAGRLRLEGSEHRVSHESIYRYIYRPKVRPRKLYRYLPRAKASRGRRYFKRRRAPIPGRRSIHERGQAIDNRATFGHWEGDLMQFRTQRGNLLTAVERKTGLTLATGLPTKTAEATAAKLTALFADLPKPARRSITFDNGAEFAHHDKLERDLGLISFFCDPHSPWQRGSIENANGIIRRDLPRKTDFADYTEQDIQDIVWVNNTTPYIHKRSATPLRCGVAMGKQYGQLDLDERIELFRHHDAGTAPSEIARIMGRHPSTIGRELRRNSLPKAGYKPASADRMAFSRRRRSSRIERLNPLRDHVDDHLAMGWSPEQIAGRLRLEGSEHRVSHESIYRYIYRPKVRPRKLYRYLPRAKASRGRRYFKRRRAPIPGRRSIHERGQAIDNRATFGHWEGDLMQFRTQRGNLLTAVERKTGLTLATGLPTKTAEATAAKLTALFADLPKPARRSITFDNGSEFAHHDKLERDLGLISFFCDPHSPWQRGSIENANGIIRRDLPRKTDFADYTEQDIQDIVWVNNTTPRKRLGYLTARRGVPKSNQALHLICESSHPENASAISRPPRRS